MRASIASFWRGSLDLALPPCCQECGVRIARSALLCSPCDAKLIRLEVDVCALCQAAPVVLAGLCGRCAASQSPLDACVAAVQFGGDVETWIHRFKYPKPGLRGLDPAPIAVARQLVVEAARRAPGPLPDCIVPVPLHSSRLRARGFNPAAVLARAVAREVGARFEPLAVVRTRQTRSQTGLDRAERRRNVDGAFRVRPGWRAAERVWLVDDVTTTGNTLNEVARALRRAGAKRLVGVCAARRL